MRIANTLHDIGSHSALRNGFYDRWMAGPLEVPALALVAKNYGAWVASFPDTIAALFIGTDDLVAKSEFVRTLYSEMGNGRPEKAHSTLLTAFFEALADKLGSPGALSGDGLEHVGMLAATKQLIEGERDLYRTATVSVGAQLALEWQAYTMLRQLYEGARTYRHLWSNEDGFHEACEYFYVHIGEAEKEHKRESLNAAQQYAVDEASEQLVLEGYDRHLDLIASFWGELGVAVS